MYGCRYEVIRNIAVFDAGQLLPEKERFILYQGAVNEARCFETLIPAMKDVDAPLVICGDGNFMQQAKKITENAGLNDKVIFKGMLLPNELKQQTQKAYIGITLFEPEARSNYYSLANRFFDYIHAGVPQVCVDFPVYRELNNNHEVAVLVNDTSSEGIARALNELLQDRNKWEHLSKNCLEAAKSWNWQEEEKKLLHFYKQVFG
jgi:glycosyltransferase involved in cell wall biosynthesis